MLNVMKLKKVKKVQKYRKDSTRREEYVKKLTNKRNLDIKVLCAI